MYNLLTQYLERINQLKFMAAQITKTEVDNYMREFQRRKDFNQDQDSHHLRNKIHSRIAKL